MSELRRQAAAIVQGMHWTTRRDEESLQAMAAEMTDLGFRASRTVTKGQGLARGFEQRDPMGWLIPLYELGQALTDAGAWWSEALGVEGYEWNTQLHGQRMDADFARLAELGDVVTAELQRSEEVEAEGGAAALLVPPNERPTPAAATQPPAPARHARPEYGGPAPTYRQRRRLAPFLWPAGIAGLLVIAGLVYAASAGHSGTSPAAAGHPEASASIGAAGLDPQRSTPASTSSPATTAARTTSPSTPAAPTTSAAPATGNGGPQVAVTLVSDPGNPQIQVLISVDSTTTAPTTLYIAEYGTNSAGARTAEDFTQQTLSGKTAYAVSFVLNASGKGWCGDQVTVEATAAGESAANHTDAEC